MTDALKLAEEIERGDDWALASYKSAYARRLVVAALRLAEKVTPDDIDGFCHYCANTAPWEHAEGCPWEAYRAARDAS